MSQLVLACHGRTPYNESGLWTGLTDVDISEGGQQEATRAGIIIAQAGIIPSVVYVSKLRRTQSTAQGILRIIGTSHPIEIVEREALNERNYGIYTGKSKGAVRSEVGEEMFKLIRRSWDFPIDGGDTLKDVHTRVAALHYEEILPRLTTRGESILVVSSNNSLRAYVKELEAVPDEAAHTIELGTAEVRIYDVAQNGSITDRQIHPVGGVH